MHQQFHADSVLQNSKAFCILLVHIPACPAKCNSTLTVDLDRALRTMAFELELQLDWFKIIVDERDVGQEEQERT